MHLRIGLVTLGVVGACFFLAGPEIALKSVLFYLPLWGACEFVLAVKTRESARCRTCDFDPILYRQDPKKARALIEAKLGRVMNETRDNILKRAEQIRLDRLPAGTTPAPITQTAPASAPAQATTPSTSRVVKLGDRNL